MANTKNAQLRYRVLDKCFKNKYRQYTFQDLLEEIDAAYENLYGSSYTSVSERTLREDIRSMRKTFDARIDATMNRQALDIIYHSYRGNEKTYAISPYYMKQYNGR